MLEDSAIPIPSETVINVLDATCKFATTIV